MDAFDIANYFLLKQDENAGDLISNLKLQKLLYYSQGLCLALNEEPLFDQRIEAWTHGPVVPDVYRAFKAHGANAIPIPKDFDTNKIGPLTREFLDDVYKVYGQFSAWKLRNMTHEEKPYLDAAPHAGEISHQSMAEYFDKFVIREQTKANPAA